MNRSAQSLLAVFVITTASVSFAAILPSCGEGTAENGLGTGEDTPTSADDCELIEGELGTQGQVPLRVETVVSGLEVPWGIAFLSKNSFLVTERPGRVRLVESGTLIKDPVATIDVSTTGETGLLGIALHPRFDSNREFFVYYTANSGDGDVNRVERFTLSGDSRRASSGGVVLDNIPAGVFHDGGRIRFGPDNLLYIGTGDARSPGLSQDQNSLAGKLLRIAPDGSVPDGNPFGDSPVFVMGIRNTQGFDWLGPGALLVTDHGPSGELGRTGGDEVHLARPGDNLGWPTVWRCQEQDGLQAPLIAWRQALPPGGAAIYTGSSIPEWEGDLIIGALGSQNLQRIMIDEKDGTVQVTGNEVYLSGNEGHGRLREVIMGPDGELYVTTSNCDGRGNCPSERDRVLRITRGS